VLVLLGSCFTIVGLVVLVTTTPGVICIDNTQHT
jgi:hypothetical protein